MAVIHLDFDPLNANHRQASDWLSAQPDPAEAVVRLIRAAAEGNRRLQHWEELATTLATEVHQMRAQLMGYSPEPQPPTDVREDPESARRLDTLFE